MVIFAAEILLCSITHPYNNLPCTKGYNIDAISSFTSWTVTLRLHDGSNLIAGPQAGGCVGCVRTSPLMRKVRSRRASAISCLPSANINNKSSPATLFGKFASANSCALAQY